MMTFCNPRHYRRLRKAVAGILATVFLLSQPLASAAQNAFVLPVPGEMVRVSPPFDLPVLKAVKVDPRQPFSFNFIMDIGNSGLAEADLREESERVVRYFLASLTTPENDLWVNLSPYEKDRIVPAAFGQTEMGRDLLAQDYLLKQITATLMYPEDELGKKFWERIYRLAYERFGTTNIMANTFNKVWIVPDKAVVYENGSTAYVGEARLKVMLEADYLALEQSGLTAGELAEKTGASADVNNIGSQVVRELIIPELEREVNSGKNFAALRQIYHSLILANWYKTRLRDSFLNKIYSDKNKVAGIDISDKNEPVLIYERYLSAFHKGVYNYIKEDVDPVTEQTLPRKYFSGGAGFHRASKTIVTLAGMPPELPSERTLRQISLNFVEVEASSPAQEKLDRINSILSGFETEISRMLRDSARAPIDESVDNGARYRLVHQFGTERKLMAFGIGDSQTADPFSILMNVVLAGSFEFLPMQVRNIYNFDSTGMFSVRGQYYAVMEPEKYHPDDLSLNLEWPSSSRDFLFFLFPSEEERDLAKKIVNQAVQNGLLGREEANRLLIKIMSYQDFIEVNSGEFEEAMREVAQALSSTPPVAVANAAIRDAVPGAQVFLDQQRPRTEAVVGSLRGAARRGVFELEEMESFGNANHFAGVTIPLGAIAGLARKVAMAGLISLLSLFPNNAEGAARSLDQISAQQRTVELLQSSGTLLARHEERLNSTAGNGLSPMLSLDGLGAVMQEFMITQRIALGGSEFAALVKAYEAVPENVTLSNAEEALLSLRQIMTRLEVLRQDEMIGRIQQLVQQIDVFARSVKSNIDGIETMLELSQLAEIEREFNQNLVRFINPPAGQRRNYQGLLDYAENIVIPRVLEMSRQMRHAQSRSQAADYLIVAYSNSAMAQYNLGVLEHQRLIGSVQGAELLAGLETLLRRIDGVVALPRELDPEVTANFSRFRAILENQIRRLREQVSPPSAGSASTALAPGGIDLNRAGMDLDIRSQGQPITFETPLQGWDDPQFEGLVPLILNISPVHNLPMFLSGSTAAEDPLS